MYKNKKFYQIFLNFLKKYEKRILQRNIWRNTVLQTIFCWILHLPKYFSEFSTTRDLDFVKVFVKDVVDPEKYPESWRSLNFLIYLKS